jgi:hypothetical protein
MVPVSSTASTRSSAELLARAAKYRRMAATATKAETQAALIALAERYEKMAAERQWRNSEA